MNFRSVITYCIGLSLALANLSWLTAGNEPAGEPLQVLFLGDEGPHKPALRFRQLAPVLARRGIELTYTDQVTALRPEVLSEYDALVLYANIDTIDPDQAEALLGYVAGGGGFVPLHSASFCFRNNAEVVSLIGAQFQRHGTGSFRTEIAEPDHPLMHGFAGFESWDETYVHHLHDETNRTVLEYRVDDEGREPWTWVKTHGEGRVFYTAWGHDHRTWANLGFHNLVERGIRYVVGQDPGLAGPYLLDRPFDVPEMTELPEDRPELTYIDVGRQIPNYVPSNRWGEQGELQSMMQEPLSPEDAMKYIVTPRGFRVELFASEPDLGGKPICMTWDERGRLWVAETYDYPNQLQPPGKGRDRIRICEDTTGDGRADKFTVFAENLSIPTSLAFYRGGVIVQDGGETIYLKDSTGDDRADERTTLITGWAMDDTHGGVSNFQYGLDNWIWAMQGYNDSRPVALGEPQQRFRMGFFRMRPDGSQVEFIRSTNNNTWGLGISEEGLIFGSTANGNPSIFMPIANRYYERVRGWAPSLTLSSIADSNRFLPITDRVRQVDHFGGYTAGAGHALYTARQYPSQYWNRTAFVNGPTGHLVGTFVLRQSGSGFTSTNPFNLLASADEWSAPIMAEVGPDGNVWIIDWYNYIVQHNPTPHGFETGRGNAYETELRDKKYGRIYRVIYDDAQPINSPNLADASPEQLVQALGHSVMLTRKHAQRLLVERGKTDVVPELLALLGDTSYDEIGLNVAAIHALWTLHGLGVVDGDHPEVTQAVLAALHHPSAGVRRNALQVLPSDERSVEALLAADLHFDRDPNVRLAAILALADLPPTPATGQAVMEVLNDPNVQQDRWLVDAATSAAANGDVDFLVAMSSSQQPTDSLIGVARLVAAHFARGQEVDLLPEMLAQLEQARPSALEAIFEGLADGWRDRHELEITDELESTLVRLVERATPAARSNMVRLATRWGSTRLAEYSQQIAEDLLTTVQDESASDEQRAAAARQAIEFQPESSATAAALLDELSPRLSPELTRSIIAALQTSRAEELGELLLDHLAKLPPSAKSEAIRVMLSRPALTLQLLEGMEGGQAFMGDLALDQKQALSAHPDSAVRQLAEKLLAGGGSLPSPDRQQVLEEFAHVTHQSGDAARGKQIYLQHCSKCHVHSGEGAAIGPDLTGMSVHPKEEMLVHILDPSRDVENNFRAYTLLTVDGLVLTGMLASESRTAVELFDTEGKRQAVLREDIEQLVASKKSIMPEGFEKSIQPEEMADLLEFLAARGKYVPLDLSKAASVATDRGMFIEPDGPERMIFRDWSPKIFNEVPFQLIAPRDGEVLNAIQLYGPNGTMSRRMPRSASLVCHGAVKSIHLLGGVAGWGYPFDGGQEASMIVRLHYDDGQTEDHSLLNGVHIADYIRRVDVPESEFAFRLVGGMQLRYLAIQPLRQQPLTQLEFIKARRSVTSPVVMAVTVETPE